MSNLTKDELRTLLANNGVSAPAASAKKEELVALYEEFVLPKERATITDFSSDDDNEAALGISAPQVVKKGQRTHRKSPERAAVDKLDNSVMKGAIEIHKLSDADLIQLLISFGAEVGPIVDSTRSVYRKKLVQLIKDQKATQPQPQPPQPPTVDVRSASNGKHHGSEQQQQQQQQQHLHHQHHSQLHTSNGNTDEFSADNDTEDDELQPSLHVKKTSNVSMTQSSAQDYGLTNLRQRRASPDQAKPSSSYSRFTPTPRRSIHSYNVTSGRTGVFGRDAAMSHDPLYLKGASDMKPTTITRRLIKLLPGFILLLMMAAVVYYIYKQNYVSLESVLDWFGKASAYLAASMSSQGKGDALMDEVSEEPPSITDV